MRGIQQVPELHP